MSDLGRKFMAAALGADGAKALVKAAEREPRLEQILVPRAIVGWLTFTAAHEYEGPVPGLDNSYVQFQKSDRGFTGNISLNEGVYSFENASIYHLAASIAMALGVETGSLDADVRDTVLVKLGKSIDTLAKAQVLMQELKSPRALTPQVITTHGQYHVERDNSSERPYSVVHTLSKSVVQKGIGSLKDAGEIASWHQTKYRGSFDPLAKKVLDPALGITFHHEHHDLGDGDMITHIKAIHPSGKVVGEAAMEYNSNKPGAMKPDVNVHPEHRRQGIASAMYAHAQKITGRQVAPSSAQSPDAQKLWAGNAAKPQFGKVELPGHAHLPTTQQGPQAPAAPMKQPSMGQATQGAAPKTKLPKAPKQPPLAVGKSEAEQACSMCAGHQFENNRFHGCICFRELSKHIKTTAYGDGYVLDFDSSIDADTVRALMKTFRSRNG